MVPVGLFGLAIKINSGFVVAQRYYVVQTDRIIRQFGTSARSAVDPGQQSHTQQKSHETYTRVLIITGERPDRQINNCATEPAPITMLCRRDIVPLGQLVFQVFVTVIGISIYRVIAICNRSLTPDGEAPKGFSFCDNLIIRAILSLSEVTISHATIGQNPTSACQDREIIDLQICSC